MVSSPSPLQEVDHQPDSSALDPFLQTIRIPKYFCVYTGNCEPWLHQSLDLPPLFSSTCPSLERVCLTMDRDSIAVPRYGLLCPCTLPETHRSTTICDRLIPILIRIFRGNLQSSWTLRVKAIRPAHMLRSEPAKGTSEIRGEAPAREAAAKLAATEPVAGSRPRVSMPLRLAVDKGSHSDR